MFGVPASLMSSSLMMAGDVGAPDESGATREPVTPISRAQDRRKTARANFQRGR
jgi:hypothetical protein